MWYLTSHSLIIKAYDSSHKHNVNNFTYFVMRILVFR